jgi:hypothetical protein
MTTGTIELTVTSRCYGNSGQYIARITGRAEKYTYAREFVGRKRDRDTSAIIDEPGIYEECDIDKKGRKDLTYVYVYARTAELPPLTETSNPHFGYVSLSESDVMQVTKRLDAGESLTDILAVALDGDGDGDRWYGYTVRTKGEAKKASVAVTIDSATDACWAVLQALPEREAKKVLAALKLRVSPPKPEAEAAAEVAPPAEPVDAPAAV